MPKRPKKLDANRGAPLVGDALGVVVVVVAGDNGSVIGEEFVSSVAASTLRFVELKQLSAVTGVTFDASSVKMISTHYHSQPHDLIPHFPLPVVLYTSTKYDMFAKW